MFPVTINYTFATQSGNVPASELDSNYGQFVSGFNAVTTYNTYFVDAGGANALAVTINSPLVFSYTAGVILQVKVAANNTGATTLNVNSLGTKNVLNPDGSALVSGQLVANGIYDFQYDGVQFILKASSGHLLASNNLSDLASVSTARANLGVSSILQGSYRTSQATVTTSTTLTDDSQLIFTSAPAGTYLVRAFLQFQGSVTGTQGFKFRLQATGSVSGNNFVFVRGIANNTDIGDTFGVTFNTVIGFSTIQTAQTDYVIAEGVITTTTTGNISVQWAQVSSSGNATILNDRSWLTISKIG